MTVHFDCNFSELKKMQVGDSKGHGIGNPIDFAFTKDYKISKFIIGGSMFEELAEKIGLKKDDDPVVSLDLIKDIKGNKIILKDESKDLPHKLQTSSFSDKESLFSKYRNLPVFTKNGEKVGRVMDAVLHVDNGISFIIGDSAFVEFAEKIGLTPDVDFMFTPKEISKMDSKGIHLNETKEGLQELLNGIDINKALMSKQASKVASDQLMNMRYYYFPKYA